jgi:23S rRNA pseudouridine1911/1915/1917 synthase
MPRAGTFILCVDTGEAGHRLDTYLAASIPDTSRAAAARLIRGGDIRVDGLVKKPGYRIRAGEKIEGSIPARDPIGFEPQPLPIDILYEDPHLVVVNKPAGLVVHPAPGHGSGTLVNALLFHCPVFEGVGDRLRPGIVHRLDKDTSGTMVVAKTEPVHRHLSDQFKNRRIEKTYLALVRGELASDSGVVSLPVGRHPIHRKQMSTASRRPRSAETVWRVRERFDGAALLELDPRTGRTHQIRVHCAAIHHPIVGDPVYGRHRKGGSSAARRQMLHAWRLAFIHPVRGERMVFESPVPEDMKELIDRLRGGRSDKSA